MNTELSSQVYPVAVAEVEPFDTSFNPKLDYTSCWRAGGVAFFVTLFVCGGVLKLFGVQDNDARWAGALWALCLIAGVGSFTYAAKLQREHAVTAEMKQRAKRAQAEYQGRVSAAANDARRLTKEVSDLYITSRQLSEMAQSDIEKAFTGLARADREYEVHAYAPFWDAIEGVASALGRVTQSLRLIASNAQKYEQLLKGRRHTFPRFSVDSSALPTPQKAAKLLGEVVRRGQQSFEFSMIWEQRRTRDVLIAGFGSLADAVDGISAAVVSSYTLCSDALKSAASTAECLVAENTQEVSRGADASQALLKRLESKGRN
jgi:hypothetical protein